MRSVLARLSLHPDNPNSKPSAEGEDPLAGLRRGLSAIAPALNGVFGDYLQARGNGLAIELSFRRHRKDVTIEELVRERAAPEAWRNVVVLVHGLASDESIWTFPESPETDFGALLARDAGFAPIYVRYNSGRHISQNAADLDSLLESMVAALPRPPERIVLIAHSMGGLVLRGACHLANERRTPWVARVSDLIFVATPHEGAPLEKAGNIVGAALGAVPEPITRLIGKTINQRSSGIKDLRFGYARDSDWSGADPDALLDNRKNPIPLLAHARHFVISGTIHEKPQHALNWLFGDALVREDSALARRGGARSVSPFDPGRHRQFPGLTHNQLPHDEAVYAQILAWLESENIDSADK